ncbi:MAG TPA: hypothetical protein VMT22_05095 [Terriglobales bacterium]|jgi:hypothetical protein|nr:hypothetical protein [Terriglobales bacterium]
MTRISPALLALAFVFFSLLSLLSVKPTWDSKPSPLADGGSRVSEIGLRVTFQR